MEKNANFWKAIRLQALFGPQTLQATMLRLFWAIPEVYLKIPLLSLAQIFFYRYLCNGWSQSKKELYLDREGYVL